MSVGGKAAGEQIGEGVQPLQRCVHTLAKQSHTLILHTRTITLALAL